MNRIHIYAGALCNRLLAARARHVAGYFVALRYLISAIVLCFVSSNVHFRFGLFGSQQLSALFSYLNKEAARILWRIIGKNIL